MDCITQLNSPHEGICVSLSNTSSGEIIGSYWTRDRKVLFPSDREAKVGFLFSQYGPPGSYASGQVTNDKVYWWTLFAWSSIIANRVFPARGVQMRKHP